jgi:GEVED domain/Secretion system C-terminal sorting domain
MFKFAMNKKQHTNRIKMKKFLPFSWLLCLILSTISLSAQPGYTADEVVTPYTGQFRTGSNMTYVPTWDNYKLADIAAGNPAVNQKGIGARSLRFSATESILDQYGYNLLVPEMAHYASLNAKEHTAIVWGPKGLHQDLNQYCPGKPSALFSNMYLPIWDGGANGTPYNDDNYLAAYLYKTVTIYKDDIRFWEIWNEPGLDLRYDIGGIGWRDQSYPGNWWAEGPAPCDYILNAPIYHYIRTLRISWEIIKTVDPDAYVCLGSVGYQSLLNAVCANTDNPNMGDVTGDFPKKGGAYFDAVSFHSYPHFDGATTNFSANFYQRHSDQAADGVVTYRQLYQQILDQYGYNGASKPRKEWIITEINSPRKAFGTAFGNGPVFGGVDAQINHMMKALMVSKVSGIHQTHVYELFDRQSDATAGYEFDLMGMYKPHNGAAPYNVTVNDLGMGIKTTSDFLNNTTYDALRTAQLSLPSNLRGYAFKRPDGSYVYAIWARTTQDLNENAFGTYSFPAAFNLTQVQRYDWNSGYTGLSNTVGSQNLSLNARPSFFTAPGAILPCSIAAASNEVLCNNNGTPSNPADDTYTFTLTVNNGTAGTWTTSVNGSAVTGTFGVSKLVGPLPITASALNLVIIDAANSACTANVSVTPPPTCSSVTNCALTATVTNKLCNDNGTPNNPADDTFTFVSTVTASGTTCGTGWFGGNALANYGVAKTFGPYPISGGSIYIAFEDNANTAIKTDINVVPPVPCSTVATNCALSAVVSNTVCSNNGTPSNPTDDTFTFDATVTSSGTTCGNGWFGGNTFANYGTLKTFGPFPISSGSQFISFEDNANTAIKTSVTVQAPIACSNTPISCDAASNTATREWIAGVEIGNMTNVTGKSTYTDYSVSKIATMQRGTNVVANLTTGYTFFTFDEYFRVWIDYNKNNVFEGSELAFQGVNLHPTNGTGSKTLSGAISVPANAPTGATKMRVSMSRSAYPDPCTNFMRGEVEDYAVFITTQATQSDLRGNGQLDAALEGNLISVYPNPTQGLAALDLRDWIALANHDATIEDNALVFVTLFDAYGSEIMKKEFSVSESAIVDLDLSSLPQGGYIAKIEKSGMRTAVKRIQITGRK